MPRLFTLLKRGAVSYADVTSANIVGFQNAELVNESGYNFLIPTFVDVGSKTATYNLQNIKLINGDGSGGVDCIEVWNEWGVMTDTIYDWRTYADRGCPKGQDGWYNSDDERVLDVNLPAGVGLYINIASENGASIQYAGQVSGAITSDVLPAGYNVIGNATPVAIDLQDLKLVGADGSGGVDCIEIWNEWGVMTDTIYDWCTYADRGCPKGQDGWFCEGERVEGVDLLPGQGVFFNNASGGDIQFTLPDPTTYVHP